MKDEEIQAILQTQTAMLIALARVAASPEIVSEIFGKLISQAVDKEPDRRVASALRRFGETLRLSIDRPSADNTEPMGPQLGTASR